MNIYNPHLLLVSAAEMSKSQPVFPSQRRLDSQVSRQRITRDMLLLLRDRRILGLFLGYQAFRLERRHTSGPGTRNRLPVFFILHVSRSENTLDARLRRSGDRSDVSVLVRLDLPLDEVGRGFVTDGVEETVDGEVAGFVGLEVSDGERLEEVAVALAFLGDGLSERLARNTRRLGKTTHVPKNRDLWVVDQPLGHDLGRSEFTPTNEDVNVTSILCQVRGLLGGTISATNHRQRLVPENRHGTITDRTSRDPTLPVRVLPNKVHPLGTGTGRHDNRIGRLKRRCIVLFPFAPVLERTRREIQSGHSLGDDRRSESFRLGTELVHHFRAANAVGETGEVFNLREEGLACANRCKSFGSSGIKA